MVVNPGLIFHHVLVQRVHDMRQMLRNNTDIIIMQECKIRGQPLSPSQNSKF
jgi:hypothetical protein